MDAKKHIPGRPKRLSVIYQSNSPPLYFVTISTFNRRPILDNDVAHDAFIAHTTLLLQRNIAVGRYVIMPDHIHLFIRIGPDERLGLTVKHLKEKITKAIRHGDQNGRIWQPSFFDHILRNDESYREKWRYVLDNPVRGGLAKTSAAWPYQGEICILDRA